MDTISASESPARKWAARAGIGCVTVLALGLPLVFGLVFYLLLSEEIVLNAGDPFRETRLWVIREGRSRSGLAWSVSSPIDNATEAARAQCVRTQVRYLKWNDGLYFEPDSVYCRCYVRQDGRWVSAAETCRLE
ncbi:MAG: hypothetical protein RMN25_01450 [Anaerolineae bacterium]|nr:hypothetical protein [Thermoflexales bacterium]MDW8406421.1 hypothetical protein [Anaerolineae bacterium]